MALRRRRSRSFAATAATPVEPLRLALQMTYRTTAMIAEEMGWFRGTYKQGKRIPDEARVLRTLGLKPSYGKGGAQTLRTQVEVDLVGPLLRAMDIDPFEVGL